MTYIISYLTKDRLVVLNYIVDATSYSEAISEIKEEALVILSCVKKAIA